MQRRHFFTLTGTLALAGCGGGSDGADAPMTPSPTPSPAPAPSPTPSPPPTPTPGPAPSAQAVLVIGAGMAGLAAARRLRDAGREVVVLEARQRLGGRLFTSTQWADAPLDVGATWIHGDGPGNPISDLARRAGARLAQTSFGRDQAFEADGRRLDAAGAAQLDSLRASIRKAISDYQRSESDTTLRDAVYRGLGYNERSALEQQRIDYLINTTYEHEYSGDASQLSALWFDSDSRYEGVESLFLDGYRVLIDFLAKDLDVRLGQVVQSVRHNEQGVTVQTSQGSFSGAAVVVTLPLGVLQSGQVSFDPPLPARKAQAIDKLGMGVLNKCFLRFPTAFWDTKTDWLNYIPSAERNGQWAEWVSLARPTGQPILLGFNAAAVGQAMEAWSDQDIVASAMRTLRTMFGAGIPDPVSWQISRWASDPFARGAYSFNKLGSAPGMREDLAAAVGRSLYFAGEATDPRYFQSVHGAYLSGQRAAAEVLAR
ncbi:flavin monoamine oxidase family protein [Pelomonas sp. BJYL3]|uniref:flavin monoamine oxidase family protein n=1 Tax=Pelomonas sp. BJYL3 TaxID=2976697 RepID=UPI0022B4FF23|nr:FAD-dependent oxidoreductase [Pelomonas sp. BJYL3]